MPCELDMARALAAAPGLLTYEEEGEGDRYMSPRPLRRRCARPQGRAGQLSAVSPMMMPRRASRWLPEQLT